MPRQARIDAPGAVHHIICRGIEQRKIFCDNADRDGFVSRLATILHQTSTRCFAWALIPNHFHLLLQTGKIPVADIMRHLLTGYAVVFNHRHHRVGHVFQNRYKSILCQMEPYLLELVRYIHLNPLRSGIVHSLEELRRYRYCGHSVIMGCNTAPWQEAADILLRFGVTSDEGRARYEAFVADGIGQGKREDLIGGGLIRSAGGWEAVVSAHMAGLFLKSDERILGDSDFVSSILAAAEEQLEKKTRLESQGFGLEETALRAASLLELSLQEIWQPTKRPRNVAARSLLCYWAIAERGLTATSLAQRLGMTVSAVSRAAERGKRLAAERGWSLQD